MPPGCLIFLVDESSGMGAVMRDTVADGSKSQKTNAQRVATAINSLLKQLSTGPDCDVALLGYRSDRAGQIDVGSRFGGPLAGRELVSLRELALAPLKVETRTRKLPNPSGFGPAREEQVSFPVWYEPVLGEGAPQVAAYEACSALVTRWSERGGDVGPPLIVHVQSGWASDGNPQMVAERLVTLATPAGPPVVLQIHLANSSQGLSALYPSSPQYVTIAVAKDLLRRSSPLPEVFVTALKAAKVKVAAGARAMLYNAKIADVIQALALAKAHTQPSSVQAPVRPQPAAPATAEDVPAAITMEDLMRPKKPAGSDSAPAPADPTIDTSIVLEPVAPPPSPPYLASMNEPPPPPNTLPPMSSPAPIVAPLSSSGPSSTYAAGGAWMPQEESWQSRGADELVLQPLSNDEGQPETFVMRPDEMRTTSVSGGSAMLIVLVLDRSLDDPAGHNRHGAFAKLQDHTNDLLQQLTQFHDAPVDVSLISYGLSPSGQVELCTGFEDTMTKRPIVPQTELERWVIRVDEFTERVSNGVGGLVSVARRKAIYVELKPTLPASPVPAFSAAAQLIQDWVLKHPLAFVPPLVLHLTRGQGDLRAIDAALTRLRTVETAGGPVQLHHLICTEAPHASVAYPVDDAQLTDPALKVLWAGTSLLVGGEELSIHRPHISPLSRGLVVNGRFDALLDGLRETAVR